MSMNGHYSTCSMQLINNINVTVPNSLALMTPFVLREQNDWFEDEIKFIRTFIKPGMKVIDIGANYGLYTLTIAKIIGDQGKIWAFEPTAATHACLQQSIASNNFNNIELIQAGLSDKIGEAKFYTDPNAELNSLSKEAVSGNFYETIALLTLDHCANKYRWLDIDFIKLDAEGEEINILKAGTNFLASVSPLIMFEFKHGENVNLPLINSFKNLGYETYRLLPGLNVLIPFNTDNCFDRYLLNLFCCKPDKATTLESAGVIVRQWQEIDCSPNPAAVSEHLSKLGFRKYFNHITFDDTNTSQEYLKILATYINAHSKSTNITERVGCLMTALNLIGNMLINGEQRIERLVTFARIAFDAGERTLVVNILSSLVNRYGNKLDFEITEPVFPASSKYDSIPPDNNIKKWLFSSIIEQLIITHAYSAYFTQRASLPLFKQLNRLGFMDKDMQRREELIRSCFPS